VTVACEENVVDVEAVKVIPLEQLNNPFPTNTVAAPPLLVTTKFPRVTVTAVNWALSSAIVTLEFELVRLTLAWEFTS
jgi:hypothetical protein